MSAKKKDKPKPRNAYARHAKMRPGGGTHKDKRRSKRAEIKVKQDIADQFDQTLTTIYKGMGFYGKDE